MDYKYDYDNARRRYYDACSEINGCENRIIDLRSQRQQKINQINQLKTDIKNNQEALEGITQIVKSDVSLNKKFIDIGSKTSQAADNYIGMVSASNVSSKNLSDVYKDETAKTKQTLSDIFESLKAKKTALSAKITDLKNQLRRAESELQDIENRIKKTEADLQSWKQTKTNASIDMEYYSRRMAEAV